MATKKRKNVNNHEMEIERMPQDPTLQSEKRIYDLEQLLDIAKSFCSTLDVNTLLESIVYICMAQMHVLGAEIFVRDLIEDESFILETSKSLEQDAEKLTIPVDSPIVSSLLSLQRPVTFQELKSEVKDVKKLEVIETFNPSLIVPLIQKNHINGILILQERIAIDDDTAYTEYEQSQIMSIASLASVAINNANLLELSSTDKMTHLKLKYYFFNLLSAALDNAYSKKEKISVLMFDIDFFKKFNDTYGHECGDFVLISVADIIRKNLRDSDVASRYGGEEFTVLLNDTDKEEAMLVADRIRTSIDEFDFVYKEQHLHVTISVGVSVCDTEKNRVKSPNEFVNQADKALYKSKNNGRNCVTCFNPNEK